MSGDPIDLDAIEARAAACVKRNGYELRDAYESLNDDVPALVAEVRRLRVVVGEIAKESLGGDSTSGTYNRSERPPGVARPDDDPWALLPDGHPQQAMQCRGCGTKWVDAETARYCERRHG